MKEQSQCIKRTMAARSGKQSRRATQEILAVQVREAEKLNPGLFRLSQRERPEIQRAGTAPALPTRRLRTLE
jgi:hypothetical protein